jgi:hypothetical protein
LPLLPPKTRRRKTPPVSPPPNDDDNPQTKKAPLPLTARSTVVHATKAAGDPAAAPSTSAPAPVRVRMRVGGLCFFFCETQIGFSRSSDSDHLIREAANERTPILHKKKHTRAPTHAQHYRQHTQKKDRRRARLAQQGAARKGL